MWLKEDAKRVRLSAGERLARLLARPEILRVPGAHNALAGLLAKKAGFEALYLSGGAVSASNGLPDLGMLALEEIGFHARAISRASGLPLIVDADTGFGGPLNVMRTVRELEDAGVAAIQIEDQIAAKRCGHLEGKQLITAREMAAKVRAAVKARHASLIVARTDAITVEGMEGALARAELYREAGADIIFPDAPMSVEMFRSFAREINAPLIANMTEFGRSPALSAAELQQLGFKIVIWPVSALRAAARTMETLYQELWRTGATTSCLARMQTREELYETLGYHSYEALAMDLADGSRSLGGGKRNHARPARSKDAPERAGVKPAKRERR